MLQMGGEGETSTLTHEVRISLHIFIKTKAPVPCIAKNELVGDRYINVAYVRTPMKIHLTRSK